ncbi:alpha/beta fold hydrolase [Haloglycomyces albus]|uniref:alpha/beta fold hydrolase n=1 Tax=Haloglycomyces albus TaxID=526067 RepID=UPI00316AD2D6
MKDRWFRIPPNPRRRLRGNVPSGATKLSFTHGTTTLWGWEWGEGPLAFAFHGWGGCTGDTQRLAEVLVENGYRVISFDAPSHGNSGPGMWGDTHSNAPEMIGTWAALIEHFGHPELVLAHSLGCFTAVEALQEQDAKLAQTGLILVAPWVGGPQAFSDTLNSYVPAGPRTMQRLLPKLDRATQSSLTQTTLLDMDVPSPTVVLHDSWDRPNPIKWGQALAEAWPNAEFVATDRLGHRRILTAQESIDTVERFCRQLK